MRVRLILGVVLDGLEQCKSQRQLAVLLGGLFSPRTNISMPLCLKEEPRDSFSLSQDKILKLKPPGCPDWIRFTHILGILI